MRNERKRSRILIAAAIFVILGLVYTLIYSGTFTTDDEHILASQSISLAFDSQFNVNRMLGNTRVFILSQSSSREAEEAANIEPALALFGALLVKISALLDIGRVQILFLANIWVTAFTAMILFLTAETLGYSRRTGMILAGLYGLATIALPYSRTFFRDPLAGLFLVCAWMFTQKIKIGLGPDHKNAGIWLWLGFGGFAAASVLAKNTAALAIPVMLLDILPRFIKGRQKKSPHRLWITAAIILGSLVAILLVWFLVVPRIRLLARFTPAYYASLINNFVSSPHPDLLPALLGAFISPGKSIFIFSPILLLSLWSLIFHFRKAWTAWLYLLLLVIFQALFYGPDWAGHVNWGLRFVLPAIPLLILSSAPVIERMLVSRAGKATLISLAAISIVVQFLGAITPVKQYFVEKAGIAPAINESALTWQIDQSIILWSANRLISGVVPDLAVWRNPAILWAILPGFVITGGVGFLAIKKKRLVWIPVVITILVGIDLIMLVLNRNDPAYYRSRTDFAQSRDYLAEKIGQGDILLLNSYGLPLWNYWMNWGSDQVAWTSLPYYFPAPGQIQTFILTGKPEDALDPISLAILEKAVSPGKRIWMITANDSPGSDLGIEHKWVKERSDASDCQFFNSNANFTSLCIYEIKE